jgi:hypothetical protein
VFDRILLVCIGVGVFGMMVFLSVLLLPLFFSLLLSSFFLSAEQIDNWLAPQETFDANTSLPPLGPHLLDRWHQHDDAMAAEGHSATAYAAALCVPVPAFCFFFLLLLSGGLLLLLLCLIFTGYHCSSRTHAHVDVSL